MKGAEGFSSLPKTAVLFALLLCGSLLIGGMLYRTFIHTEIAIGSIADPVGTARLIERLELLDADYRVQKDGSILVDESDAARLQRQGLSLGEARPQPDRAAQGGMLLLLFLTAGALALVSRRLAVLLRDSIATPMAAAADTETRPAPEPSAPVPTARAAFGAARLFEGEHPQTVAVYLLGLATAEAAAAMEAMGAHERDRVWERMAFSGSCDEGLRMRVAELFAAKAKALQKRVRPAETTVKMLAIYRSLSPGTRTALLNALRRGHPHEGLITLLEAEAANTHRGGEG
ncbi:hypothetical protein [Sulfurimonas diazotrophicus]|uniref:Flagellar motor switch protein FliG middle domain-containing protein n=1 Tax=Sulfurimonas diazotrophicus TaxID=3131939 RepID=A0ABZ3HAK7_9BACT